VTEVIDAAHAQQMDPLTLAVLQAESHRARSGWGQPPQLYALASKEALADASSQLDARIRKAPAGSFIPVEQDPLPEGEPLDVLAGIAWPDDVAGCVLVTEVVILPPDAQREAPRDPDEMERWARDYPGSREARLAVGVSRSGDHACVLRLQGDDGVQIDPQLADDLVTALLETFITG
jgi:hypothetical protein